MGIFLPEPPFGSGSNPLLPQPSGGANLLLAPTNALGLAPSPPRPMTPDEYLQSVLAREAVDTGPFSLIRSVQATLQPILSAWANKYLVGIHPSGSFAKGTANKSGTDIDLFISLSDSTPETLKQIYDLLFKRMQEGGYTPKQQNVSINVNVGGYDVDLVPARLQNALQNDHSLYRRKADTWTKTNVITHINHIAFSGRLSEIRTLKLWRNQKGLDFPSFYLEMTVLAALEGKYAVPFSTLADNVWTVLVYLRDTFPNARVADPANTNNVISDDLTVAEKLTIKAAAERALSAKNWNEIVV
jgi:hypothetical protein